MLRVPPPRQDGPPAPLGHRRLHVGGRARAQGWEVFDARPGLHVDHQGDAQDLSRFAAGTFVAIYASHVIEHFDYATALLPMLTEWRRVLVPQGTLYVSVPDLDVLTKLFLRPDLSTNDRFQVMRMMFGGHVDAYDFHQVGLNEEFLRLFLSDAGFVDVTRVSEFGLFADTSTFQFAGVPISLNLVARRP